MIVFRQADPRYPFLWRDPSQPAGRWHGAGEGPAHYFADTPDGAWAELLRHEEIDSPEDAATLRRALWVVDIGKRARTRVSLDDATSRGGPESYPACQAHARALREAGAKRLEAPSAALAAGGAAGRIVTGGRERPAAPRDGLVVVVFGSPADIVGWKAMEAGMPPVDLLRRVRPYRTTT